MVYLHGGAFMFGSGTEAKSTFYEHAMAKRGVVCVSLNYRLGILGFVKVEDGDYNCGMYDQIAALEWVQENIQSFGGDPKQVTVVGESAGSISIAFLIAAGYSGKLFHRAIMESGTFNLSTTKEQAAMITEAVARVLGEPDTKKWRDMSAAQLLAAQTYLFENATVGYMPFGPVIDGQLYRGYGWDQVKAGAARGIPIMIGYCKEEEHLLSAIKPGPYYCKNMDQVIARNEDQFGELQMSHPHCKDFTRRLVDESLANYIARGGKPQAKGFYTDLYVDMGTQLRFTVWAHILARLFRDTGSQVHMFRFDVKSPTFLNRACHEIDLPYVFGQCEGLMKAILPKDRHLNTQLSAAVMGYWEEFIKRGSPCSNPSEWPPLPSTATGSSDPLMVFDLPFKPQVEEVDWKTGLPLMYEFLETTRHGWWAWNPVGMRAVWDREDEQNGKKRKVT